MNIKNTLRSNSKLLFGFILLLAFFFFYIMLPISIVSLDYWPNSALAYNIAAKHTLYVDNFWFIYENTSQLLDHFDYPKLGIGWGNGPWYFRNVSGHLVSTYPPTISFMAVPIFSLADIISPSNSINSELDVYILWVAKINGAFFTALSVFFVWLFLTKTHPKHADALTLVYGCSTLILPSSHTLNNHLGGLVFLPLAWLFAYTAIKNPKNIGYAGLFAALAYASRPTNIVSLGVLFLYSIFTKKDWKRFFIFAAIPVLVLWSYNYLIFDSPFTSGYTSLFFKLSDGSPAGFFDLFYINPLNIAYNLLSNLFSPNRGIFFFSPVLLFSIPGMIVALKNKKFSFYRWILLALILTLIVFSSWKLWTGGLRYGYTMSLDIIPYFVFFIAIYEDKIFSDKKILIIFVLLAILSFLISLLGLSYGCDWSNSPINVDLAQERVWDFNDLQILRCFR